MASAANAVALPGRVSEEPPPASSDPDGTRGARHQQAPGWISSWVRGVAPTAVAWRRGEIDAPSTAVGPRSDEAVRRQRAGLLTPRRPGHRAEPGFVTALEDHPQRVPLARTPPAPAFGARREGRLLCSAAIRIRTSRGSPGTRPQQADPVEQHHTADPRFRALEQQQDARPSIHTGEQHPPTSSWWSTIRARAASEAAVISQVSRRSGTRIAATRKAERGGLDGVDHLVGEGEWLTSASEAIPASAAPPPPGCAHEPGLSSPRAESISGSLVLSGAMPLISTDARAQSGSGRHKSARRRQITECHPPRCRAAGASDGWRSPWRNAAQSGRVPRDRLNLPDIFEACLWPKTTLE